jgi:hypothetical protein
MDNELGQLLNRLRLFFRRLYNHDMKLTMTNGILESVKE